MKNNFFVSVLGILLFTSCQNSRENEQSKATVYNSPEEKAYILDYLLSFDSEAELKKIFPNDIERSIYYYNEGMSKSQTTILFPNSKNAVRFTWEDDTITLSKLNRISLSGRNTDWKTKEGITIGTSIERLEKLNKRTFSFLGLDWDYGGHIDWDKGALSERGIFGIIEHPENADYSKLKGLIGDKYEIQSSSKLARNSNLFLGRLTMWRVKP
jgi:hypothetical protein